MATSSASSPESYPAAGWIAITRQPGPDIVQCALSFMDRAPIDPDRAAEQHIAYDDALRNLGVQVNSLPPLPGAPDAPFVEDTVVVVDEIAVMTQPALPSRQTEVESVSEILATYRPLEWLSDDARLEGGDVMRVDRTIYVGLSGRTNQAGIDQLRQFVAPYAYTVHAVPVDRCLHLKTASTYVGRGTVIANPEWVDTFRFEGLEVLPADPSEPFGGNGLLIRDTVIMPASAPKTATLLREHGFEVVSVDISELEKAEAGLTCCSIVFRA